MTAGRTCRGEGLQHGLVQMGMERSLLCFPTAESLTENLSTHRAIAPTQMPVNMDESMGEMVASPLKMACYFLSVSRFICKTI